MYWPNRHFQCVIRTGKTLSFSFFCMVLPRVYEVPRQSVLNLFLWVTTLFPVMQAWIVRREECGTSPRGIIGPSWPRTFGDRSRVGCESREEVYYVVFFVAILESQCMLQCWTIYLLVIYHCKPWTLVNIFTMVNKILP